MLTQGRPAHGCGPAGLLHQCADRRVLLPAGDLALDPRCDAPQTCLLGVVVLGVLGCDGCAALTLVGQEPLGGEGQVVQGRAGRGHRTSTGR